MTSARWSVHPNPRHSLIRDHVAAGRSVLGSRPWALARVASCSLLRLGNDFGWPAVDRDVHNLTICGQPCHLVSSFCIGMSSSMASSMLFPGSSGASSSGPGSRCRTRSGCLRVAGIRAVLVSSAVFFSRARRGADEDDWVRWLALEPRADGGRGRLHRPTRAPTARRPCPMTTRRRKCPPDGQTAER